LQSVIIYFTGGVKYSVPESLALNYLLGVIRIILLALVLCYYFQAPFSVLTIAIAILYADFRFYMDFSNYMDMIDGSVEEDNEEE
jgi:CBS domain containing-hemolysin-like protein